MDKRLKKKQKSEYEVLNFVSDVILISYILRLSWLFYHSRVPRKTTYVFTKFFTWTDHRALALAPFVDKGLSWFTARFKFKSQGQVYQQNYVTVLLRSIHLIQVSPVSRLSLRSWHLVLDWQSCYFSPLLWFRHKSIFSFALVTYILLYNFFRIF